MIGDGFRWAAGSPLEVELKRTSPGTIGGSNQNCLVGNRGSSHSARVPTGSGLVKGGTERRLDTGGRSDQRYYRRRTPRTRGSRVRTRPRQAGAEAGLRNVPRHRPESRRRPPHRPPRTARPRRAEAEQASRFVRTSESPSKPFASVHCRTAKSRTASRTRLLRNRPATSSTPRA